MEKFYQLRPVEQGSILFVSSLCLAALLYFGLWHPLNDSLNREKNQHADVLQVRSAVEDYVRQITRLRESVSKSGSSRIENLTSLVNESLQERQLQLSGMQQQSADQVQIRLENVAFSQALAWIYDLDSLPGLIVAEVSVRPAQPAQAGQVSMTVGLSRKNDDAGL